MKRMMALIIAAVLMLTVPVLPSEAAGSAELGEMLIESLTVTGSVGDVVKVNFELYPNLPDGRKLDSLSGRMRFDPEFVTLGAINQEDEENNLTSLMKGKASSFQTNINDGELQFAFIDAFGVEAEGFWFQAEFRIEKEGATSFVFNGIQYTGVDSDYKAVSFYIEPRSVGGIYTEGESVPTGGAADETFAPSTPLVRTPVPVTPTPRPSNGGQSVPVTSTLPTYSGSSSGGSTGIVTPQAAVTSMPVTTPHAPDAKTAAPSAEGSANSITDQSVEPSAMSPDASAPISAEGKTGQNDPTGKPGDPSKNPTSGNNGSSSQTLIVIGIIIGIVAVIGLGALAIVIVYKRREAKE